MYKQDPFEGLGSSQFIRGEIATGLIGVCSCGSPTVKMMEAQWSFICMGEDPHFVTERCVRTGHQVHDPEHCSGPKSRPPIPGPQAIGRDDYNKAMRYIQRNLKQARRAYRKALKDPTSMEVLK